MIFLKINLIIIISNNIENNILNIDNNNNIELSNINNQQ